MSKKSIKFLSIVLALTMLVGLFSGCGDKNDADSDKDVSGGKQTKIEFLVDPEEYRGTKVVYATWKDPKNNEDGPVVENFEKKYGIEVEIMLLNQTTYVKSIASAIASGNSPDIYFETGNFPGSLTVMQPLDNAKINFEDPIWNQNTIKYSTIDGHPYLLDTVSNVWSEADICVYNKKIFEDNNITSPQEYYDAGKWTYAAFKECAKNVASLGPSYVGATIMGDVALAAAGCSIFTYENGKFNYNLDDHLIDVMTFLAQMREDKYVKYGREEFTDGKTGMALTNCFALKKTGYFTTINPDHLGAVPLPTWEEGGKSYSSGIYRGWGLVKGAKNPVAAGIFLREYLDVNNYDLEQTFHSDEVANFYFTTLSEQSEDVIHYPGYGISKATGIGETYNAFNDAWRDYSASQIRGYLESQKNVMQSMCDGANDIMSTEKKWLADNYK